MTPKFLARLIGFTLFLLTLATAIASNDKTDD